MSSTTDYGRSSFENRPTDLSLTTFAVRWLPLALVFVVAIACRHLVVANTDIAWLSTVGEKMLDGHRLYVDIIETNPPASVLLYLPLVALARFLGMAPERVIDSAVFLAIGASLWFSGRILTRAKLLEGIDGARLATLVAIVLAILPAQTFAEREHIVVIILLPAIAVWMMRLKGLAPDRMASVFAGIGIGISLSIKPHFVLAIAPAVISVAIIAKSWRPVFGLENWIGGFIPALYAASVFVFFPVFVSDMLPVLMAAYVPVRHPLSFMLTRCPVWVLSAMLLWLIARRKPGALRAPQIAPLLVAAFGFGAVVLIQSKGWPYHTYPVLAMILFVLASVFSERGQGASAPGLNDPAPWKRRAQVYIGVILAVAVFYWMNAANSLAALNEPIRRLVEHPRMLVLTSDISVGHPLVREVNGIWVGRMSGLWAMAGMVTRSKDPALDAETARQLAAYAKRDRDMLEEDIRRNRPDIIVADRAAFDWYAWAQSDPGLAAHLRNYREVTTIQDYLILHRRDADEPKASGPQR